MADGSNPSTPTNPTLALPDNSPIPRPKNYHAKWSFGNIAKTAPDRELIAQLYQAQQRFLMPGSVLAQIYGISPTYLTRLKKGERPLSKVGLQAMIRSLKKLDGEVRWLIAT